MASDWVAAAGCPMAAPMAPAVVSYTNLILGGDHDGKCGWWRWSLIGLVPSVCKFLI